MCVIYFVNPTMNNTFSGNKQKKQCLIGPLSSESIPATSDQTRPLKKKVNL